MKLQFKEQDFQLDAVQAVVDCFEGQPLQNRTFTIEQSRALLHKARLAAKGVGALDFEVEEGIGYRNAPVQITEKQVLENIRAVQKRNGLFESKRIERPDKVRLGYNLTIEMETGTGKTYAYIRSMYELHKHYGWSKFIIIVPSIAIREGVYKSFQVTQDHFQEIYHHKINPFIYNSSRTQDIENFASDSRISVMIINTQAFNARGADARRIYQELDSFGSRKPIEVIAQTNPILIIDEPQSVDGVKTLESMQEFMPLFTLRYSATHKEDYNKIYRLDALDAYNKKLVKKIQVKGINLKGSTGTSGFVYFERIEISSSKPPAAILEFEVRTSGGVRRQRRRLEQGANLFSLSGEMPAYDNIVLTEIDAQQGKIVLGGQEMFPGDVMNDEDEYTFRRIQIRETILSHFEKEIQLFPRGIKVLTLFFIDSVEKYRQYDGEGEQQPGEYAEIFEEEYNKLRSEQLDLFREEYNKYLLDTDPGRVHRGYMPAGYSDYLERDEAEAVHEGYFSIDKKGRAVDPKVKRGSESSDDISAYDLIMKDKERLMSLEEPVRFIFSHSALKEGWDNPNVFQICALKNPESGSETRRRQEVGRGMRLCVDNNGQRMDIESVGELVHSINKLTVVASESYEAFAKGLQNEIAASLKDRPKKVTPELFANKVVREESGKEQLLTKDQARELLYELMIQKVVDRKGDITEIGRELIEKDKLPLPEEFAPYREDITNILKSVYTGEPFRPENERNTVRLQTNHNFARKEFQELWDKISLKTIYEVRFDTEKLVHDSIVKINANLNIRDRVYEIVSGELDTHTREELESNEAIKAESRGTVQVGFNPSTTAVYDIVGEIESRTHLTRRSITRILKGLKREKFLLLKKNPEVFIARCSGFINEVKATLIFSNIVYHKTEQRHDAKTVFSNDNTTLRNAAVLKKHIYDYLATDSKTEAAFVKALEESTEVTVYARLPRSFYITTPVANYSPDWAIVFDKEKVRHIYFVAETKGSDSGLELREIEKLKIHCAGEHFKEISGNEVVFKTVSSFETLMEVVQMK